MLLFFPTPYPGEWWYSILCRYHIRTGWAMSESSIRELCGRNYCNHASLFPNSSVYFAMQNIPEEIFSVEKMLTEHTLLPYYLRFFDLENKKKILSDLVNGKDVNVKIAQRRGIDNKQGLRFCPQCYVEDTAAFGEPYWHREHQISLMPLCPKHKKPLKTAIYSVSMLKYYFRPLSEIQNSIDTIESSSRLKWEAPISNALHSILTLPFEISPSKEYSNLKNVLKTNGFISYGKKNEILDMERLYQMFVDCYGDDVVKQYFKSFSAFVMNKFFKWKILRPERYALLSVCAGLTIEELLGPEIQSAIPAVNKLIEYQKSEMIYSRRTLEKSLGIKKKQLDFFADKYNITPFWTENTIPPRELIRISLNTQEKQEILRAASTYGNDSVSSFAKGVLMQEIRRLLNKQNEDA